MKNKIYKNYKSYKVNNIDVSVCIVNYKADKELKRCLESIKRFTKRVSYETIVIDNSENNRWYSGGNNLAAARAKGRYLFFANPDVYFESDAVSDLVGWMDKHPAAGAAEPLQLSDKGDILPTGSKLNSPWLDLVELTFLSRLLGSVWRRGKILNLDAIRRFRQSELDRRQNWKTEVVSGAAMMVRKEVFDSVGGFCNQLKLYYTDTDLCRRMILSGREVWHLGKIHVVHSVSASTSKLNPRFVNQIFAEDAGKYYRLTGRPAAGELLYLSMLTNGRLFLK